MLERLANVEVYRESELTAADIFELAPDVLLLATGSHWRRDGVGTLGEGAATFAESCAVLTPDDIFAGRPTGARVLIYDDEHYFMGGGLAERFLRAGSKVTLVSPGPKVSAWCELTDEQYFVQKTLLEMGLDWLPDHRLVHGGRAQASFACIYTGRERRLDFDSLVLVTGRLPNRRLYDDLCRDPHAATAAGIALVERIGDCLVPSSIADAVYGGHRSARAVDSAVAVPKRERPELVFAPGASSVGRISNLQEGQS
jgi:dimethylamine/trimethylamine dehydrogenase